MVTIKSPYIVSEPVSGKNFFDREDKIQEIENFLDAENTSIFLIHGQRRIGKTSILRKTYELAHNNIKTHPVFFNLQGFAEYSLPELLYEIAKEINKIIDNKLEINKDSFSDNSFFHRQFINYVLQNIGNKKLVLLFDEFDTIGDAELIEDKTHSNFAFHAFIPYLEKMLEFINTSKIQVKLIVACGRNYKDLEEKRFGHLLCFARQTELDLFSFEQTLKITNLSKEIPFDKNAAKTVFEFTGGHPMFTQCLCDASLWEATNKNLKFISQNTVEQIYTNVIKQNASAVLWIWHTLPDKAKIILFLIAQVIEIHEKATIEQIKITANGFDILPSSENIHDSINLLVRNRFLTKIDSAYSFTVEFIRKWILLEISAESIQQLVPAISEELNLFFANARYFYKSKNWKQAVEWYLKIYKQLPENFEVLSNLAICYYYLNNTEDSYNFFEKSQQISAKETQKLILINNFNYDNEVIKKFSKFKPIFNLDKNGRIIHIEISDSELKNISALKELKNLTHLKLSFNQISDISPLKHLTNLKRLELNGNRISDISPINELYSLIGLDLSDNQISNISPVKLMKNLKELYLSSNQISDISAVQKLISLNKLDLSDNQIFDISPIKELKGLSELILSSNQISDIKPVKELTNLIYLYIGNNQIADISPVKELKKLKQLYLSNNLVSDTSSINELINQIQFDFRK